MPAGCRSLEPGAGILRGMSDFYIRLIPTDARWQPTAEAASAAAAYVARLFSGPGDAVERVDYKFYERTTLIDAGEWTDLITCSRCTQSIDVRHFFELMMANSSPAERLVHRLAFDSLEMRVPCCGAVVALDTLLYDPPFGFARFELSAMNATRAAYELDAEELAEVAALLGHPLTQVLAHY